MSKKAKQFSNLKRVVCGQVAGAQSRVLFDLELLGRRGREGGERAASYIFGRKTWRPGRLPPRLQEAYDRDAKERVSMQEKGVNPK